jgi:PBSX family phage terminase large subunit
VKFKIPVENMLPHQLKWWQLDKFYKVLLGGYGSGKTYIGALRSIFLSYENAPIPGVYVSPSYGLSQKTIVLTLKEVMDKSGMDYTYNQMKGEFVIHNWNGRIWLGSGDRPDSLRGPNLAWAGIDEPFIQKKDVFDQMVARVRHPDAKQREIFLTGTPEQLNWGYQLSNREDIDLGLVVGSTLENTHLPQEYKDNLLSAYSDEQIDAYVHGKFVNLTQGRVYKDFDREKHLIKRPDLKNLPVCIAQDYNVDNASAIAFYLGNGWIHVFKEYRMSNANTYDMAELIMQDFPGADVYCDASGSSRKSSATSTDHDIMRQHGFNLKAPRRNPSVRDRVNCVNKLIRDGNFSVESCPNLIMDLERNVWRLGDIDKRDPTQTHLSDALGYAINILFPLRKRVAVSEQW